MSASLLGEPDVGLLTPPEMARKASQICYAAPSLTVFADADTGGGSILNVQRTIKQLIGAGCKGCFIEDQEWPKRMGHARNKSVIPMDEFAAKARAWGAWGAWGEGGRGVHGVHGRVRSQGACVGCMGWHGGRGGGREQVGAGGLGHSFALFCLSASIHVPHSSLSHRPPVRGGACTPIAS